MLVVIGANGRTGVEIVREALCRGLPVRAVVRPQDDLRPLAAWIRAEDLHYADADHPSSLEPVLEGAHQVISCIDPRAAGRDVPGHDRQAAAHIVRCAARLGIDRIVHLSVMGSHRWSPGPLSRRSFHMDAGLQRADLPSAWTLCRVSGYHDELIAAHLRPPDGGRPHPLRASSRYSPLSRRDAARALLQVLPHLSPGQPLHLAGPEILSGSDLHALLPAPGRPRLRLRWPYTPCEPLPHGDLAIHPQQSGLWGSWAPRETLAWALDPVRHPLAPPPPHPADRGQGFSFLRGMGPHLRWTLHEHLVADLGRLRLPTEGVTLDFSGAAALPDGARARVQDGEMVALSGVRAVTPDGALLHSGGVTFLHDARAEIFLCWWQRASKARPAFVRVRED